MIWKRTRKLSNHQVFINDFNTNIKRPEEIVYCLDQIILITWSISFFSLTFVYSLQLSKLGSISSGTSEAFQFKQFRKVQITHFLKNAAIFPHGQFNVWITFVYSLQLSNPGSILTGTHDAYQVKQFKNHGIFARLNK